MSEPIIQAVCGLMHLHGLAQGRPRRIGLEVGSVAAGVLAAQGVLAALIARRRGSCIRRVKTSVVQAALLTISQCIARWTCRDDPGGWLPKASGPAPGPPFASSDGHWVEVETFDPEVWRCFWVALGVESSVLGRAWTAFSFRYSTSRCTLPRELHEATSKHTLGQLARLADEFGMSLSRVRSYGEVLKEPGLGSWQPMVDTSRARKHGHDLSLPAPQARGGQTPAVAGAEETAPGTLPLTGLQVVEATSRVQGPLAGQLLRMLGATVTRVEPVGGDPARMTPPIAGDTGAFFLSMNRGKDAVQLDLSRPAGRSDLMDLVAGADVFLHNWRPGKASEWRVDFEDLASCNPRLVYCQASAWGDRSGIFPRLGVEFQVQAYAGVGHGINPVDEPPLPSNLLLTDFMAGLVACEAILRALYLRELDGHAYHIHTSLLTGAMTLQAHVLTAMAGGTERNRSRGRPLWGPLDRPIRTADGFVTVVPQRPATIGRLAALCGIRGGSCDLERQIVDRMATKPAAEWEQMLSVEGIPCAIIRSDLTTLPEDALIRPLLEEFKGAWMPGRPWKFSA
ncbi:MAG: CoA transferase [Actinomycetota bacterium]|nr:CoA transferase [Actinomycetota bacterium]